MQVKGTITLTLHLHNGRKKTSLHMGWLAPTIVLKMWTWKLWLITWKKCIQNIVEVNNPIMGICGIIVFHRIKKHLGDFNVSNCLLDPSTSYIQISKQDKPNNVWKSQRRLKFNLAWTIEALSYDILTISMFYTLPSHTSKAPTLISTKFSYFTKNLSLPIFTILASLLNSKYFKGVGEVRISY